MILRAPEIREGAIFLANMTNLAQLATDLDRTDKLRPLRDRFVLPKGVVYLDGNSLGAMPVAVEPTMQSFLQKEWGERLIRGWNDGWWEMPTGLGDQIGRLVGANPGETLVCDNTTTNLYKLAWAVCSSTTRSGPIVTDDQNFPSDLYILREVAERTGRELVIVPTDGIQTRMSDVEPHIGNASLLALSLVAFKSGALLDGSAWTRFARDHGVPILWDVSHAVGVVPVAMGDWRADFAVGCCYKHLHGGPGAPAFLSVRSDWIDRLRSPIPGWFGHADPFAMTPAYTPDPGIRRFLTGSSPIASLKALASGLDLVEEAGLSAIRAKSERMTAFAVEAWEAELRPLGFELSSPANASERGSHVTLGHPSALAISRRMTQRGVIPDFRPPNGLRLGFAPLYNSFGDIVLGVEAIKEALATHGDIGEPLGPVT